MTDLATQLGGGRLRATVTTSPLTVLAELNLSFPEWRKDAACKETEVNFFPRQGQEAVAAAAKAVCARCLCRAECLDFAMADKNITGVWGGTSAADRNRARRRKRGEVRCAEG